MLIEAARRRDYDCRQKLTEDPFSPFKVYILMHDPGNEFASDGSPLSHLAICGCHGRPPQVVTGDMINDHRPRPTGEANHRWVRVVVSRSELAPNTKRYREEEVR